MQLLAYALSDNLRLQLRQMGYHANEAKNIEELIGLVEIDNRTSCYNFEAVVVSTVSGIADLYVTRLIRNKHASIPLIVLGKDAKGKDDGVTTSIRAQVLNFGGDDYLTVPFDTEELKACLRARIRRNQKIQEDVIKCGPIEIFPGTMSVTIDGERVHVTGREFKIMYILGARLGTVYSREALIGRLWEGRLHAVATNINTFIKRIRQKLDDVSPGSSLYLESVYGEGYRLTATPGPKTGRRRIRVNGHDHRNEQL